MSWRPQKEISVWILLLVLSIIVLKMAFTQADNCMYDIMHDEAEKFRDNIVTDKKVIAIWADISRTLYNPTNAKKARLSAYYNMPEEVQALYNLREEDGFCELKEGVKRFKKGG